jgi:O-acetyl-ADP-ribose deacetylase (regulator of RNase III)
VGIAGKGVALQFKKKMPGWFEAYRIKCQNETVNPGVVWAWQTGRLQPSVVFNMATKQDWRFPSKLAWIKAGIDALASQTLEQKISIACPAVGCGCGGLDRNSVLEIIRNRFTNHSATLLAFHFLPN